MKKLFAAITIATSFLCASTSYAQTAETYTEQDPLFDTPFTSYENAKMPYRIPAIVQTTNNAILVFADKRHDGGDVGQNGSDNTRIDLVYKKSLDYGKTWSKEKCLIEGQSNYGYGDAAVVSDREDPNKILVMCAAGNTFFTSGKLECHKFRSNDGGESWIDDDNDGKYGKNVTSSIYDAIGSGYSSAFFSSGRICQSSKIKVGSHYRLYAALCVNKKSTFSNKSHTVVLYSDNFGESWSALGTIPSIDSGNEAKCEELPNGNVLVSSRKSGGRYFRVFNYTNGVESITLSNLTPGSWTSRSERLTGADGGSTNGEILIVPCKNSNTDESCYILLHSIPMEDDRTKVGIYWTVLPSDDITEGSVFPEKATDWGNKNISQLESAYSSMIIQGDGNIGFVYEDNYDSSLGKGGYDIRYKNLTLSEITGGAYTLETEEEEKVIVETPAISPNGGTYTETASVTISCATSGATIHYTLDGTTPTTSSAVYTGAITLTQSATVKAIAVKSGCTNSEVASAAFTITAREVVATPVINPNGGTYTETASVTITCATSGATIHYTLDGTTPTTSSAVYTNSITLTESATVKAIAVKSEYANSSMVSAEFIINENTEVVISAPAITNNNGVVIISSANEGATIYYTTDGSAPSTSSTIYTAPFILTTSGTIKAITTTDGKTSEISTETFTVSIEEGKQYLIHNLGYLNGSSDYNNNQYIQPSGSNFGVTTRNVTDANQIWSFESDGNNGWYIYNNANNIYIGQTPAMEVGFFNVTASKISKSTTANSSTNNYTITQKQGTLNGTSTHYAVIECKNPIKTQTWWGQTYNSPYLHLFSDGSLRGWNKTDADSEPSCWEIESIDFTKKLTVKDCEEYSWATFFLGQTVTLPDDVTAYVATETSSSCITIESIGNVVPANTPVILKDEQKRETITITLKGESTYTGKNLLTGASQKIEITDDNYKGFYIVGHSNNKHVGFFHPSNNGISAGMAYLTVPEGNEVKSFSFIEKDNTTDINEVNNSTNYRDDCYYDLFGRRVDNPTRGIYIKNGKKYYFK